MLYVLPDRDEGLINLDWTGQRSATGSLRDKVHAQHREQWRTKKRSSFLRYTEYDLTPYESHS